MLTHFNHLLRETFSEIMSCFLIVRFQNCLVFFRSHRFMEFFHAFIQQILLSTYYIPLQYSCLGNPMDRGAWWVTVLGVAKESDRP